MYGYLSCYVIHFFTLLPICNVNLWLNKLLSHERKLSPVVLDPVQVLTFLFPPFLTTILLQAKWTLSLQFPYWMTFPWNGVERFYFHSVDVQILSTATYINPKILLQKAVSLFDKIECSPLKPLHLSNCSGLNTAQLLTPHQPEGIHPLIWCCAFPSVFKLLWASVLPVKTPWNSLSE